MGRLGGSGTLGEGAANWYFIIWLGQWRKWPLDWSRQVEVFKDPEAASGPTSGLGWQRTEENRGWELSRVPARPLTGLQGRRRNTNITENSPILWK